MTRRKNVTQEDFDRCIADLQSKNNIPTVSSIVHQIGGSYTTIGNMFSKWQEENDFSFTQPGPDIPESVIRESNELLVKWWNKTQEDASISIRQIQETSAKQIAQIKSEASLLVEDLQNMERQIEELTTSHETATTVLTTQHQLEVDNLKTKLSGITENRNYLKTALDEKSKEAKTLNDSCHALQQKYTDLVDKLANLKQT